MLVSINKILYSTDLSKGSAEAFKYALFLAKTTGADIHILHVLEKLSSEARMTLEAYVMDVQDRKRMLENRHSQAQARIQQDQDAFWAALPEEDQDAKLKIKSVNVIESFPAEAILKLSRKLEVDLIVMGTHEKGVVETFLGSVAKSVLSRSRIPVLVVPLPERQS